MTPFKPTITVLYADEAGKSHFKYMQVETSELAFAPPAPAVSVSAPAEVKRHLFLSLPGKWYGEPHPAPNRQMMTVLNGSLEVTVSDGTTRIFRGGDTALVEDTTGDGHATRNLGDEVLSLSVTQY
ncbi:MAG: cupin domain-containing protein [Candidatus Saccharimonadales bacterium]